MHSSEGDPDFVLSLARGLQVIEAFHDQQDGLKVAEVAAKAALSRAAARRLLLTLEALGYAERTGPIFRLTSRVLRLGFGFLTSNALASLAGPVLQQLSTRSHESCSVSVLDGNHIVYVARSAPKRVMTVDLSVGSRLPAYCTSMGRVLLAALPPEDSDRFLAQADLKPLTAKTIVDHKKLVKVLKKVRSRGYAIVDEELELGLRSVAVPITSRSGHVVAAMNAGVSAARVDAADLLERILPLLVDHARLLGHQLA